MSYVKDGVCTPCTECAPPLYVNNCGGNRGGPGECQACPLGKTPRKNVAEIQRCLQQVGHADMPGLALKYPGVMSVGRALITLPVKNNVNVMMHLYVIDGKQGSSPTVVLYHASGQAVHIPCALRVYPGKQ